MSESESDLELQESIIHTRTRRANAGNRMKNLLAASLPEDEDEDEIFKEVENDGEFDMTAYKQVKREVGASDFSSDSEISEDDKDLDEGERTLAKQQRQAKKEQRRKDREKMFKIKTPAPERVIKKKKPERTAEDTIEILMANTRRASQRRSAIDNRRRTIERLRENERKRSEYATPVYRKKVKLTQAQRLAEAKITEEKNTASLHNFVEMEEQRKYQQRMALLGKRRRITEFVRFVSRSIYEYPVPTEAPPAPYYGYSAPSSAQNMLPISAGSPAGGSAASTPNTTLASSSGSAVGSAGAGISSSSASAVTPYQYNPRGQLYAGLDDDEPKKGAKAGQLGQLGQLGQKSQLKPTSQLGGQLGGQLGRQLNTPPQVKGELQEDNSTRNGSEKKPPQETNEVQRLGPSKNSESPSQVSPAEEPKVSSKEVENSRPEFKQVSEAPAEEEAISAQDNTPMEDVEETSADAPAKATPEITKSETANNANVEVKKEADTEARDKKDQPDATKKKPVNGHALIEEISPEDEEIRDTSGPPAIRCFNSLTLEEFSTPVNNKLVARGIILGENNLRPPSFPPKRICPFTGEIAKFVDPQTGLAYLNIHIYRLIKRIKAHEYVWSSGAGGVYTQPWASQRHAKGVPPGFANEKDLPEPSDEIKKKIEERKRKGATAQAKTPATPVSPAPPEVKKEVSEQQSAKT